MLSGKSAFAILLDSLGTRSASVERTRMTQTGVASRLPTLSVCQAQQIQRATRRSSDQESQIAAFTMARGHDGQRARESSLGCLFSMLKSQSDVDELTDMLLFRDKDSSKCQNPVQNATSGQLWKLEAGQLYRNVRYVVDDTVDTRRDTRLQ